MINSCVIRIKSAVFRRKFDQKCVFPVVPQPENRCAQVFRSAPLRAVRAPILSQMGGFSPCFSRILIAIFTKSRKFAKSCEKYIANFASAARARRGEKTLRAARNPAIVPIGRSSRLGLRLPFQPLPERFGRPYMSFYNSRSSVVEVLPDVGRYADRFSRLSVRGLRPACPWTPTATAVPDLVIDAFKAISARTQEIGKFARIKSAQDHDSVMPFFVQSAFRD